MRRKPISESPTSNAELEQIGEAGAAAFLRTIDAAMAIEGQPERMLYLRLMQSAAMPWLKELSQHENGHGEPSMAWAECVVGSQRAMVSIVMALFVRGLDPQEYERMAHEFTEELRENLTRSLIQHRAMYESEPPSTVHH